VVLLAYRQHSQLIAPHVGGARTQHQQHDAGCGERRERGRDLEGGGSMSPTTASTSSAPMPLIWRSSKPSTQAILSEASGSAIDCASFMNAGHRGSR
jgi:hypothetical protein